MPFEWGVSSLTRHGEKHSGDRCLVKTFEGGTLVAVIDALGHGEQAARAADVAARMLEQNVRDSPVGLVERCHAKMRSTRGAAIGLASFDWRRHTMTWLGVGNVAGVLLRARPDAKAGVTQLLMRGGVVGDHLPELQTDVMPLEANDTLIVATDGVRSDFMEMLPITLEPQRLAERILDDYARSDDDATVLVFQRTGGGP